MENKEIFTPSFLRDIILFVVDSCKYCRLYREFVGKMNMNLPLDKQIEVIDCSDYYDYGIIRDPRIRKYAKYFDGNFPVFVFHGYRLDGANTRVELESFLKALFLPHFILEVENEGLFVKDCEWIKNKVFGRTLVCN